MLIVMIAFESSSWVERSQKSRNLIVLYTLKVWYRGVFVSEYLNKLCWHLQDMHVKYELGVSALCCP